MGFTCSILHQSWVQTSCNGLKSNLYDSNGYKVWLCYQEVAKIRQMQWNFIFKWFKIMFIAILSEIGNLDGPCCTDPENKYNCLENNLNGSQVKKAWYWDQEVAKIHQNAGKLTLEEVKITFYAILSEIWDLYVPYCTNLGYKLVVMG